MNQIIEGTITLELLSQKIKLAEAIYEQSIKAINGDNLKTQLDGYRMLKKLHYDELDELIQSKGSYLYPNGEGVANAVKLAVEKFVISIEGLAFKYNQKEILSHCKDHEASVLSMLWRLLDERELDHETQSLLVKHQHEIQKVMEQLDEYIKRYDFEKPE